MAVTLLDIVKMNNDDGIIGVVEETIVKAPELEVIPAEVIPGMDFSTLVRTALPSPGFRNAGEGAATVQSQYVNRVVQAFIMDCSVEVDKATLAKLKKPKEMFFAREAKGMLLGGFRSLSSQFYYGTATTVATSAATSPTKGFPGLVELHDSSNKVVDAGGSTALTSVWFVRKGEEYLQWVLGSESDNASQFGITEPGEIREVRLTDGSSNPYDGYRMPWLNYVGLQGVNPTNSIVRIKKVGTDTGKGLTDSLLSQAWELVDDDAKDDWVIFMNKRSQMQLQRSRTATTATGADVKIPDNWEGVPIKITTGLKVSESA